MADSSRQADSTAVSRLEIRDLRLMDAVCAEGTLTKAGARLNVTQPALSRHLATLEARLGTSLFTRKGVRMHPTASGELLLRRAREVLERMQETETELRELTRAPQQTLRVGVDCYTGYHWLPRVVNRYAARHPGVDVQIAFEAIRSPVRRLRDGVIDVALVTDGTASKQFASRRLFEDEYIAVVEPGHRLAARSFVTPADFANERVLLMSDPANSNVMATFFRANGVSPRAVSDVQLVGAVAALAESGFGVGMVPSWTIAPEIRSGRLVALKLGRGGFRRVWTALLDKAQARQPWMTDFLAAMTTDGPWAEGNR